MKRHHHNEHVSRTKVAAVILVFLAALAAIYCIGQYLDGQNAQPETRGNYQGYHNGPEIEVNGVRYRKRDRLTTILLIGVDRRAEDGEPSGYRNGGQADFLRLVVIDNEAKTVSQIEIDRDTMTPITVLGVTGKPSRSRTAQISLSHGFGDGREQSCELTLEAVSNLLLGTPIDFYIALNMDGIPALNDAVGGVTVTLADDFSAMDAAMTPGTTLTLRGKQAEIFVRGRMEVGDGTNESRMARQELYMTALAATLDNRFHNDKDAVGAVFDAVSPYLTSSISRGRLINEVWASRDYARPALMKPQGEHNVGKDGFMEFHVDEASLQQIVLDALYERVD